MRNLIESLFHQDKRPPNKIGPVDKVYRALEMHNLGLYGHKEDGGIYRGMESLYRLGGLASAISYLEDLQKTGLFIPPGLCESIDSAVLEYVINNNVLFEQDKQSVKLNGEKDNRIQLIEDKFLQLFPTFSPTSQI